MRILTHRKTRRKKNITRHERNAERTPLHVSKGDTVRVMRGDDAGKEGTVMAVERVSAKSGESIPRSR